MPVRPPFFAAAPPNSVRGTSTAVEGRRVGPPDGGWPPLRLLAAKKQPPVDWDAQIQRHGRRVLVSLLARGALPERAKELAQDAWLRIIQNHRKGKLSELRLPGVVVKQAVFLLQDDRRRSPSKYPHESVDGTTRTHRDERELERRAAARHELRRVQAVIARAHPNAQRVFELLYGCEARSPAEIADELKLSVQRVRQIGCELRKVLRAELKKTSDA